MQPEWPADKVERRAVAALIPYARNARMHSAEQIDQIAASIREWGWTAPVLIDDEGGIIAGHGRVLAAHKLAIAEVPVMVAAGWSEAQKRAYVLADNKLVVKTGWYSGRSSQPCSVVTKGDGKKARTANTNNQGGNGGNRIHLPAAALAPASFGSRTEPSKRSALGHGASSFA